MKAVQIIVCLCILDKMVSGHSSLHGRFTRDVSDIPQSLITKWTQCYHFYDADNSGLVHKSELQRVANYLIEHATMTQQKQTEILGLTSQFWSIVAGAGDNMTLSTFLNSVAGLQRAGVLATADYHYRGLIFNALDENNQGSINKKEFELFALALGHTDLATQRAMFDVIDVDDAGQITRDEYIGAYSKYVSDPHIGIDELPLFETPASHV